MVGLLIIAAPLTEADSLRCVELVEAAEAWYVEGEYDTAAYYYAEALRYDGEVIKALVGLGRSLNFLGRYDEAAAPLETAVRLDPAGYEQSVALGFALNMEGRNREAVLAYKRAVQADTTAVYPLLQVADILRVELLRYGEAQEYYKRALAIVPSDGLVLYALAQCQAQNRELDEAVDALQRAGETDPSLVARAKEDPAIAGPMKYHRPFYELLEQYEAETE